MLDNPQSSNIALFLYDLAMKTVPINSMLELEILEGILNISKDKNIDSHCKYNHNIIDLLHPAHITLHPKENFKRKQSLNVILTTLNFKSHSIFSVQTHQNKHTYLLLISFTKKLTHQISKMNEKIISFSLICPHTKSFQKRPFPSHDLSIIRFLA